MKVIEIRNLCLSYDKRMCEEPANWAGLYIMKQILRNIQLKQLKNAVNETELWIPEYIVKGVDNAMGRIKSDNRNSSNRKRRS